MCTDAHTVLLLSGKLPFRVHRVYSVNHQSKACDY